MQYKVTCPLCQSKMMVTGQPAPEAKIQCPAGGHVFHFKSGAPAVYTAPSDPTPRPPSSLGAIRRPAMSTALGIGIIAAILVAAGGIVTAIILTRTDPAPVQKEPDPLPSAKNEQDRLEKERAESERLAKELADKERADKDKADKDRADREKADQERLARE